MRLYLPLTHLYQGVDLDPLPSSFLMRCHHGVRHHFCHLAANPCCFPLDQDEQRAGNEPRSELCAKEPSLAIMGLLTVIKKVKAKEKEIRLLMV